MPSITTIVAPSDVSEEDLTEQAFAIADECMQAQIECHAVAIGEEFGRYFGLVDENGCEVRWLIEADPAIAEAFEWLRRRRLAEIVSDEQGQCIRLLSPSMLRLH